MDHLAGIAAGGQDLRSLYIGVSRDLFRFEGRQHYDSVHDGPLVAAWQDGERRLLAPGPWQEMIRRHRKTGITVERVRLVTEPWTPYTAWELPNIMANVAAGEEIRVIVGDHPAAADLTDQDWLIIDDNVHVMHYTPAGRLTHVAREGDARAARGYRRTRQLVWDLATPLADYLAASHHATL